MLAWLFGSPLEVGATAPPFSLPDENGRNISLAGLKGKPVVLVFYPGDDTTICTAQLCEIRDHWAAFKRLGAAVFGVNGQGAGAHGKFSEKYKFPSDYSKTSLSYNEAEILSAQFSNLSSGLLGYLSLSIISLSCFLALFIFFLTCKKFPWPFCCSGIFYVTQVCSEVFCIIALTASSRITLYGNCHYLSIIDDSLEIMNVCGDNASVYGLIISLVIIVNDIFLLVCFCYRKNTPVNVGSLETQEESEHVREFGIRIRKKDEVEVEDIEQPE